tara:strand:+ start:38374 stop:39252 length:879 start_codon:yes stop_codon:yes gene_type:complete
VASPLPSPKTTATQRDPLAALEELCFIHTMRSVAGRLRQALILAVLAMASACAVVPGTGRMQLNIISPAEEQRLGRQGFAAIRQQMPVSQDENATAMVQRVGQRIADVADLPKAEWEFVLFQNPEPNAFCLPGGKVGVHTGMLPITQDDAGLATVIAHEVAHAVAHHGAERMSEQILLEGIAVALFTGLADLDNETRIILFAAYGIGTTLGRVLPHSRLQETEADRIGLIYMARAGYDPAEAVAFWERFAEYKKQQGGAKPPAFLSTHPMDAQRIENLKRWLPRAKLQYRPR